MDSQRACSTGELAADGCGLIGSGRAMHHSHSTPAGVDGGARTPPATPKKAGKMLAVRVQMLDDSITMFQIQAKALGRVLFEQVCKQLHLLEADYFGLEYHDLAGTRYWLDLQKPVSRQLGLSLIDPLLRFCVKFYTPDPGQLEEEFTRYLFCLQIKRDLAHGHLQCNDNTAALMASYIVQAECGDFVPEDYPDHTYLSSYKFVPHQDHDLECRIMENHKKHAGQSPAEADLNLLETARRCEFYGMKMHPAKDHEGDPLELSVAHMGIVVFQHNSKINTFSWAKIRKISFKRKRFLLKLHPESYGFVKDLVEFFFEGRDECKNFWKKCVEHHGFFRCTVIKNVSRHKPRVLSRGSSFRYSGKTQKQMVEFVRDNYVKRQTFQRSASFRHSAHSSAVNVHTPSVGTSISAHPLLPLADPSLAEELDKASRKESERVLGVSQTTKAAYRRRDTATHSPHSSIILCQSPDSPTILVEDPRATMSSPSPPLTTQSVSVEICTNTSKLAKGVSSTGLEDTDDVTTDNTGQTIFTTTPDTSIQPMYSNINKTNAISNTAISPQSYKYTPKSEGSLYKLPAVDSSKTTTEYFETNQSLPKTNIECENEYSYTHLSYKPSRSQDVTWQRSASCRELSDYSKEEPPVKSKSTKSVHRKSDKIYSADRKLESPITRYDDSHKNFYNSSQNNSLDIQQDIVNLDQKVYSSSYPGTMTLSRESVEDPGNYELAESQDDLSHDSYELLERSDDDVSTSGAYRYRHSFPSDKTRSGSLDSGNYLQSVSDSDSDDLHRYKSASDVHDIFSMDDPRDLPREINPPKSDGSFYKHVKLSSRTSSLESKSDYYESLSSSKKLSKVSSGSRTSSIESKSDREGGKHSHSKKSVDGTKKSPVSTAAKPPLPSSEQRYSFSALNNEPFDGYTMKKTSNSSEFLKSSQYESFPTFKETTHVHSVSLQNVETEQSLRNRALLKSELNTLPRTQKSNSTPSRPPATTHIWPESIYGLPTEISDWSNAKSAPVPSERSKLESNIFSFDDDKIRELSSVDYSDGVCPAYDYASNLPLVDPEFPETIPSDYPLVDSLEFKENESLTKSSEQLVEGDVSSYQTHPPIERTKSDPNTVTNRQRLSLNSRRHTLMHQKSIDLTPAESSDEDYIYRQIPSAPPLTKALASRFEMPAAEFGHFDILPRENEGTKTKFEVPKSQFEILGAKNQFDLINLPPKDTFDIPYILHKRHVMNGTAPKVENVTPNEPVRVAESPKEKYKRKLSSEMSPKLKPEPILSEMTEQPPSLDSDEAPPPQSGFLFTQNVDLSNINPVTLEIDKNELPVHHLSSPKRDITKIDPSVLETLNMKLSRIESDSPPMTERHPMVDSIRDEKAELKTKIDQKSVLKSKYAIDSQLCKNRICKDPKEVKPKRTSKSRGQGKKSGTKNKGKIRITSFSSDDESLDSDDVFGTAEATPTKSEFSPPQHRKEMESILKYESERQTHLQYTMSSTEIEGSPPQPRKTEILPLDRSLDITHTELRRISERSLSIPSSEDDFNVGGPTKQPLLSVPDEPILDRRSYGDDDTDDKTADITDQKSLVTVLEQYGDPFDAVVPQVETTQAETTKVTTTTTTTPSTDAVATQAKLKSFLADVDTSVIRRGVTPGLFAHARLNLSEGSGFTAVQRQAAIQSPTSARRAKSLDTAVVSVTNLPPPTAFSSQDDTVDTPDEELVEKAKVKITPQPDLVQTKTQVPKKEIKMDLLLPVAPPKPKPEIPKKGEGLRVVIPQKSAEGKPPKSGALHKDRSLEKQKSPKLKTSSQLRTTRSHEEQAKRSSPKEKSKSFEKLEPKRTGSKERSKSQDDNEVSIAKRKEKQQMLYETAIKQTKTLKSPVKEIPPTFPVVEDSVSVSDGKLEIKIDVTNFTIPDDAIIITKSPKKLDKKLTKSLELNFPDDPFGTEKQFGRLGKSLDLEQRKHDSEPKPTFSLEAGDTSEETSDIESETNDPVPMDDTTSTSDAFPEIEVPRLLQTLHFDPIKLIDEGQSMIDDAGLSPLDISEIESTKRQDVEEKGRIIPKITNDDESLTEVSEIKCELLKKMSSERSKSEDTASWMTVECDEVIGQEGDNDLSLNEERIVTEDRNYLHTLNQSRLLKFSDTRSRSSDTTGSWTSGEKDTSPINHHKDTVKSDESSVSCAIIRPFGISQHIEQYDSREQLEKNAEVFKGSVETSEDVVLPQTPNSDSDKGPRSPLKRSSQVDEESSSDSPDQTKPILAPPPNFRSQPPVKGASESSIDSIKIPAKPKYPFEQKWLSEAELQKSNLKPMPKLSADKSLHSSLEEYDGSKNSLDKPRIQSLDKLSVESKNSVDTESSSGSLGAAIRMQKTGEAPIQEPSSTWRPFLIESSGSSSLEDGILPPDYDIEDKEYMLGDAIKLKTDDDDVELPNLDANFPDVNSTFSYPGLSTVGLGLPSGDILPNYGTSYLARTLSRISERSSNSEKSSLEDSSKHSHYDSMNEESMTSSDQQVSLSSEASSRDKAAALVSDRVKVDETKKKSSSSSSPLDRLSDKNKPIVLLGSNLQRQISDDRRTSAEMADISLDDVEIVIGDDKILKRQNSDDTIIEEHSECVTPQLNQTSSQESEDWPLPEIPGSVPLPEVSGSIPLPPSTPPTDKSSPSEKSPPLKPVLPGIIDDNYPLPKIFGLRSSLQSEDSGQWPSPPSSICFDAPVVGNIETYYLPQEEACKVIVADSISEATPDEVFLDSTTRTTIEKTSNSGSDDSFSGLPSYTQLDKKQSSDEETPNNDGDDEIDDVLDKPVKSRSRPSLLLKQTSVLDAPGFDDEVVEMEQDGGEAMAEQISEEKLKNEDDEENSKSTFSLTESNNMTTVLCQNLSGSHSGTSKSYNKPLSGLKDDDSSLFDNLSLSEWSSSNSHPLGPNSPLTKSSHSGEIKRDSSDSLSNKLFTKSTERPVKIPHLLSPEQNREAAFPGSGGTEDPNVKILHKSMSYDQSIQHHQIQQESTHTTTVSNENNFKTVPLIRSHRTSRTSSTKKSYTDNSIASTASSMANVHHHHYPKSDRRRERKTYTNQTKKMKILRQRSKDRPRSDSDSDSN